MTVLVDGGRHVPETAVDIGDIAAATRTAQRVTWTFRRFFGLGSVRRAPDMDIREILTAAAGSLTSLRGNEHRVRYVISARTVATVSQAGENPTEDVCVRLGLTNAVVFTLTQH